MRGDDPKGMIRTLIGSYGDLSRRLTRRLGAVSEAQDVLQDTWIKLAHLPEGHEISNPRAYAFRVAENLAIDHLRARNLRDRHMAEEAAPDIAENAPSAERVLDYRQRLVRLQEIVADLPPRQREVFLMHKFDELSHAEIATRLGISRSAVEKLVMKALAACRDGLGDLLDAD